MQDRVFIADLHLSPQRPEIIELFLRFAGEVAASADQLYILGDFLEYWLGDDDPAPHYQTVFDCLRELGDVHHTEVLLMHGNRDFLIGHELAERCHFRLIDDPFRLELAGQKALLMHGDTLCTDDIEYQQFRTMVRSEQWISDILGRSLQERRAIARQLREQSRRAGSEKEEVIMDVNQASTDQVFIDNDISLLIHGHTHRPAIHHRTVNGRATTRVVLGDWFEAGSYLRINSSEALTLKTFVPGN